MRLQELETIDDWAAYLAVNLNSAQAMEPGQRIYWHQPCSRPEHRNKGHRVSLPPEGTMLMLCPLGAYRIEPAYWGEIVDHDLAGDWPEGSYVEMASDGSKVYKW